MGDIAELIIGLIVLIVGVLMGPGVSRSPRALVGLILLIVGLVLVILGALSFADTGR